MKPDQQPTRDLVSEVAPSLLDVHGLGADGAAVLLVAAGDNPERIHSEAARAHLCGVAPIPASSGKTIRHRLNRGGNRQANSVCSTRSSSAACPPTPAPAPTRTAAEQRSDHRRDRPHAETLRRPRDLQTPPRDIT